MYTPAQAIEAINARINGEWDNDQLIKLGALSTDPINDIKRIVSNTYAYYSYPRQTPQEAGYKFVKFQNDTKEYIFLNTNTGIKEVFMANKWHAGWALSYAGTELEFCYSLD